MDSVKSLCFMLNLFRLSNVSGADLSFRNTPRKLFGTLPFMGLMDAEYQQQPFCIGTPGTNRTLYVDVFNQN